MVYLRMYIKSFNDENETVKIDFNSIKVDEEERMLFKTRYKSSVSEERFVLPNKIGKLTFSLTKLRNHGKMFMYGMICEDGEISHYEKNFVSKIENHFRLFYSVSCKKGMDKIISIKNGIFSQE